MNRLRTMMLPMITGCMRTTVTIDDDLLAEAKSVAAKSGRTLGDVLNDALRVLFSAHGTDDEAPLELPAFGDPDASPLVDILDRDALASALGDDRR